MDSDAYRDDGLYYTLDGMGRDNGNKAETEQTRKKGKRGESGMIAYNENVIYEGEIQSIFTPREMAETIHEAILDMDYMDYEDGASREEDIEILTEQIQRIKNADFEELFKTLEYLTDRFL